MGSATVSYSLCLQIPKSVSFPEAIWTRVLGIKCSFKYIIYIFILQFRFLLTRYLPQTFGIENTNRHFKTVNSLLLSHLTQQNKGTCYLLTNIGGHIESSRKINKSILSEIQVACIELIVVALGGP